MKSPTEALRRKRMKTNQANKNYVPVIIEETSKLYYTQPKVPGRPVKDYLLTKNIQQHRKCLSWGSTSAHQRLHVSFLR